MSERIMGTYLLDGYTAGGFKLEDPVNGVRHIAEFYELGYAAARCLNPAYEDHVPDVERLRRLYFTCADCDEDLRTRAPATCRNPWSHDHGPGASHHHDRHDCRNHEPCPIHEPRRIEEFAGVMYEAWPEHGVWYELGRPNEIGALHRPMLADGSMDRDSLCGEIEVLYEDA